jgi:hypothetical protein
VQLAVDLACVLLQLMSLIAEGGVERVKIMALSLSLSLSHVLKGFNYNFMNENIFPTLGRSVGWLDGAHDEIVSESAIE